ncbi:TPA: hypothetical protein UL761_000640 [Stenotrophomonas maltophilia]|nr:hypothetical protein [Stenotrophomonas maltophilia]
MTTPSIRLQAAFAAVLGTSTLESRELIDGVMDHGFEYRGYVQHALTNALNCGMVERVGGRFSRRYRLNQDWKIDPKRLDAALAQYAKHAGAAPKRCGAEPRAAAAPLNIGPAINPAPLVPSIGTACMSQEEREGELPPYLGGRIADSLHSHFDRILGGVE